MAQIIFVITLLAMALFSGLFQPADKKKLGRVLVALWFYGVVAVVVLCGVLYSAATFSHDLFVWWCVVFVITVICLIATNIRRVQIDWALMQDAVEDLGNTINDTKDMFNAKTFEDLSKIALRIIKKMPRSVGIVSGPISNGGAGSVEKNLEIFKETIERLRRAGENVFDQMPFEEHMFRISQDKTYFKGEDQLLQKFYLPLFESGFIQTMYFIRGWQTSYGAKWEHGQAIRLSIGIRYL